MSLTSASSKDGDCGSGSSAKRHGMTRGRRGRAVWVVGCHVEQQRLLGRRAPDHVGRLAGEHVGQMVVGPAAVVDQRAVLVEGVVEVREFAADAIPFVPAGQRFVFPGFITVHQLADQGRVVPAGLQPGRNGGVAEPECRELLVAAGRQIVAFDPVVVRVLPAQDRCPRRAAERVADEIVVEHRALVLDQGLGLRHHPMRQQILVVGKNEHDARPRDRRRIGCESILCRNPQPDHDAEHADVKPFAMLLHIAVAPVPPHSHLHL